MAGVFTTLGPKPPWATEEAWGQTDRELAIELRRLADDYETCDTSTCPDHAAHGTWLLYRIEDATQLAHGAAVQRSLDAANHE